MNREERTLRVAAQLLAYPDEELLERLPLLRTASASSYASSATHLLRFIESFEAMSLQEAQQRYVDTFDLRRRCCPYLTYYSYGDTRKRGMALLRFTHAYRAAGYELDAAELPDHLAVVCEFTATAPAEGGRLFREHRAGVELLRSALADMASPYVEIVDAIRAVLPDPAPRDLQRAMELAEVGPPVEQVGLQ